MQHAVTREHVLDVAQAMIQTRGYNAFSFRDVAAVVGIKTASIHYYFPTKTDLCRALIERQRTELSAALGQIDAEESDPNKKLSRYVSVFRATLELGNRMCLCGMLAADVSTLDAGIVAALRESFLDHENWLESVLRKGKRGGFLDFLGSARDQARMLLASLEGAMLLARTFEDVGRFESTAQALLSRLIKGTNRQASL